MQINIIDVGEQATHTAKNGRSYQSVEITYKGDNGQTSSKKLMSFANPDVFKQAGSWKKGKEKRVAMRNYRAKKRSEKEAKKNN